MPWLTPVTLEGRLLRLEPVTEAHGPGLVASADERTFAYFTSWPEEWTPQGFLHWILTRTPEPFVSLAMVEASTGRVVGCSTYFDVSERHRKLEIGYTWVAPDLRGTWVNPEAKLLMIGHAVETLGAVRVQLKCDARNAQSRAAMTKLGAVYEGTLRNFVTLDDGHLRSNAYFSVLPEEWPHVKAGLEARLDAWR